MTESKITLFVDDMSVVLQAIGENQLREKLTDALDQLSPWHGMNDLKFNVDKTKVAEFENGQERLEEEN